MVSNVETALEHINYRGRILVVAAALAKDCIHNAVEVRTFVTSYERFTLSLMYSGGT
jgi:hypothetical protein